MNDKKFHEITNCNYDNPCGPFDIPWEYWADVGNFTIENTNNNIKKEDKKKCKSVKICISRIIETYMNDLSEVLKVNHVNYHCNDCQKYYKKFEFTCNNLQNSKYNMIYEKCSNNIKHGDEYFKRASQKVPTVG
ncbi:hypothetical protein HCN44_005248 [Aphidius gifuensis]|uniref:lysozyme n=1 Tax=Aphidius gifuensis TaxID=684658 RepID=A0A834Y1K1_APHGI|nr:hypothetical protein HCN44_005248 [Aphidius gifuensis]